MWESLFSVLHTLAALYCLDLMYSCACMNLASCSRVNYDQHFYNLTIGCPKFQKCCVYMAHAIDYREKTGMSQQQAHRKIDNINTVCEIGINLIGCGVKGESGSADLEPYFLHSFRFKQVIMLILQSIISMSISLLQEEEMQQKISDLETKYHESLKKLRNLQEENRDVKLDIEDMNEEIKTSLVQDHCNGESSNLISRCIINLY